jgi:hypothetical protein
MHSGIPPLATRTAGTPTPPAAPQVRQYPISTHDFERIDPSLPPSRAQEIVVPLEWELKELASHAVVCLVSYGVQVADRETGELELVMRSYRKVSSLFRWRTAQSCYRRVMDAEEAELNKKKCDGTYTQMCHPDAVADICRSFASTS